MREKPSIALILFLIVAIGVPAFVLAIALAMAHPSGYMVAGLVSIPLILFLFRRAYLGLQRGSPHKARGIAFGLAGLVLSGLLIAATVNSVQYGQARRPLLEAMVPVCQGQANPGSAAYTPGQNAPLAAIEVGKNVSSWSSYPDLWGWEPKTPGEVVLVACITDQDVELSTCRYGGGGAVKLTRFQNRVEVRLIEAATGAVLGEQEFLGEKPGCPDSVSSGGTLRGKRVDTTDVKAWLEPFYTGAQELAR